MVRNRILLSLLVAIIVIAIFKSATAETNTVSSTVVTNNTPPTANSPSVVVNNSDVCKTAVAGAVQTQILGVAGGTTIKDLNCERLKLSRALYGMGMKVAAVIMLCQDPRVFNSMEIAGTPCPYKGKSGQDAATAWAENPEARPDYEEWLKRNDLEEEGVDGKSLGIGAGLLLLLLL